jgi:predicted nucleic acid-binding protein
MRLVFLDAGPLGLLSSPRGKLLADQCWQWTRDLFASGARVIVPEIADYEVRRELLRLRATAGLQRLDQVKATFDFVPITSGVMIRAAELWATSRRTGRPTSAPDALDGDCILAALAQLAVNPGDIMTVATSNLGHLGQFVDAVPWDKLTP